MDKTKNWTDSLGVALVSNQSTRPIAKDLMHQLKTEEIGTWKTHKVLAGTRHRQYQVPDHIQTICPHCERDDVLLVFQTPQEIQLCTKQEEGEAPQTLGIKGVAICNHCKSVSDIILHGQRGDEWEEIWIHPKPIDATAKAPEATPVEFAKDYREAIEVLGISPNASAALARRGLERVLKEQYSIKDGSLNQKIDKAIKGKRLPSDISDMLGTLREIGNHGAHALDGSHAGEIVEVSKEEAILSMEILREVLDYAFARPARRAAKKAELAKKYKNLK